VVPNSLRPGDNRASRICAVASSSAPTPTSAPSSLHAFVASQAELRLPARVAASPDLLLLQQHCHVLVSAHAELGLHHRSTARAPWSPPCRIGCCSAPPRGAAMPCEVHLSPVKARRGDLRGAVCWCYKRTLMCRAPSSGGCCWMFRFCYLGHLALLPAETGIATFGEGGFCYLRCLTLLPMV
jgi:hypothetical protein